MGLLHAKSYVVAKRPPVGEARKFGEGVSSSLSDLGSKLRGPSLNDPRVASKRDVNLTQNHSDSLECGDLSPPNATGTPVFNALK
ncbi:hypothetical protein AVEN_227163-1 [Araneus ventricosus]|uniref:Uncharacterized protein n=1 Tax=Araneus ventricosus TaxID=182803 RepID=A0A4Y2BUR4_ARAVE|nr:hypothetical protein AVEN_227163-1 [Araneus ventricosus]